jgi:hypothetical protein
MFKKIYFAFILIYKPKAEKPYESQAQKNCGDIFPLIIEHLFYLSVLGTSGIIGIQTAM